MLFRSNELNSQVLDPLLIARSRRWSLSSSLILHVLAMAFFFGLFALQPRSEKISLTILEKPAEVPRALPPSSAPLAQLKPKKSAPQKKAVFGVSSKSLQSEAGVSVKLGNTVAKAPDQEKLEPGDQESLPIPADEIQVTQMPKLLSEVRIPYPQEAKQNGIQGAVVMDLLIDAAGQVRQVEFLEGPGYGLNEAAMTAVRGFRFSPALIESQSVAVRIRYAYRFVLER